MKTSTVHIFNGDMLAERLTHLNGDKIIMREVLTDGPVLAHSLEELVSLRASYFLNTLQEASYKKYVVPEFDKLNSLKPNTEINLWFEEDLFCQVNLWFLLNFLIDKGISLLYLILPGPKSPFSFGHLSNKELVQASEQKIKLKQHHKLKELWKYYSTNNLVSLKKIAQEIKDYPFILRAVEAHIQRSPKTGLSHPEKLLLEISKEIGSTSFIDIFPHFNKRANFYGYGDLQVRKLWDNLVQKEKLEN